MRLQFLQQGRLGLEAHHPLHLFAILEEDQGGDAQDAKLAGGGVPNNKFDLSLLVDYIPKHKDITGVFRAWADSSEEIFIRELTNV